MFIPIGLFIAFVLLLIFTNRQTRQCKWRADRRRDEDGQSFFWCTICGAEGFTSDAMPPKLCLNLQAPPDL